MNYTAEAIMASKDENINIIKKLSKYWKVVDNSRIYHTYYHRPLIDNLVFIESRNGRDIAGNILRIALEIKKQFGNQYKICTAARPESQSHVKRILRAYGLDDVKIYKYESAAHYICLERSHFLINDTTFTTKYIKREGQIYLNTWHGTPYKQMGRDSASDMHLMENVQRNLMMADYLLFPSVYCAEKIIEGFCIDGLYPGNIIEEGYPRNSVFFDDEIRKSTRFTQGLDGKKVFAYMPTYREEKAVHQDENQINQLRGYLEYIDENLDDDELLFVKVHYYVKDRLELDRYKHIRSFPEDIETYEFLTGCDCLITDYSSVIYDFANSGHKIIRFVYDEEEYLKNRGVYEQPVKFPFSEVKTGKDLLSEMRKPKIYDDKAFLSEYCTFENKDAAKNIVSHIFLGQKICNERKIHDGKEHVVIYGGSLALNGITKSLQNLMSMIDDGREYYICFFRNILSKEEFFGNTANLPENKKVFSIQGSVHKTIIETIANYLFYKRYINAGWIKKQRDKIYKRELQRSFYNTDFSAFIQFGGYDWEATEIFERANVRNAIFVHNDMLKEVETKGNQHRLNLHEAYSNYDKVALVSEQLIESTAAISGKRDNIIVVENCQNFDQIKENSLKTITTEENTEVKCKDEEDIAYFLEKHDIKFVTIGRFSEEKRHDRLIEAFEIFHNEHQLAGLIIIGGYGDKYEETLMRVEKSSAHADIMVIKAIKNPMPILRQCDLFILSSDYEGLPLVLLEANTAGIPCIATDVPSVVAFMDKYKGKVVERSVDGVLNGMKDFMQGKIGMLDVDYSEYNRKRLLQFEEIFK